MKTPNDHIFRLIQAMSAAEKRYFKVHFASDNSLLTQLFDHLNQRTDYKEAEIKEHFAQTSIAKNLKVYKVQLSEAILKSLAAFRHKKGLKNKLRIGIEEVNALRAKRLFTIATNKINQLKKLATIHQQYQYLLHLLQIELEMSAYLLDAQPLAISQAYQSTLQKINTNHQLHNSCKQLESFLQTIFFTPATTTQFNEIVQHQQQVKNIVPADFTGRIYCHLIEAACAILLKQDYTLAIERYENIIPLFTKDGKYALYNVHPELYWKVRYRLLQAYVETQRYALAKELITKTQKWLTKTLELQYSRFYLLYLQIEMVYRQENYTKFETVEKAFFATVESLKRIERYEVSKGLIFLTLIHLQRKNFTQAQFYLRRLHGLAKQLPKVFSLFFDLLELLTHYHSQEISLVHNSVTACKRKQYDPSVNSIFFNELLKAFQRLSAAQPVLNFDHFSTISPKEDALHLLYQHFALDRFIPLKS